MKFLVGFIVGFGCCVSLASPVMATTAPEICFVRPGENGSVNILPVTIQVKDFAEITINGEEEDCLKPSISEATTLAITLRFPHPYWGGPTKPPYWTTSPVSITIRPGQSVRVLLCPRVQDRNDPNWETKDWHRMWVLSPPENNRDCGPEYQNWKKQAR